MLVGNVSPSPSELLTQIKKTADAVRERKEVFMTKAEKNYKRDYGHKDSEELALNYTRDGMRVELDKALSELPPEQREAVLMTEFHGMPVKEAARRMGVPQNTFLSRKHYAVLHIRKRLHALYNELINN